MPTDAPVMSSKLSKGSSFVASIHKVWLIADKDLGEGGLDDYFGNPTLSEMQACNEHDV
jgi:hypothetical protein